MESQLAVFENKAIRSVEHNGEMYFSVVDIIEILTDSPNPSNYWNMLKKRENQLYTVCVKLKLMILMVELRSLISRSNSTRFSFS
jgi:DNA-damage-inducible protein D